jgi:hypothetical protein
MTAVSSIMIALECTKDSPHIVVVSLVSLAPISFFEASYSVFSVNYCCMIFLPFRILQLPSHLCFGDHPESQPLSKVKPYAILQ